ncbi:DsbA family protein, partial [Acidisphaera rubrifaciens]|uniref:DsbA family protein n=1 Tax=Acidisphaera rubrifaciens TaxID=50715 RepID=UPI0006620BA1
ASRAVVVLRRRGMAAGLAALRRLHAAFYAEGQDVTDPATLAALAAELGMDAAAFAAEHAAEDAARETQADFAIAQAAGIRGFPTLLAGIGDEGSYALVTHGFQPAARIVPALDHWLATPRAPAA